MDIIFRIAGEVDLPAVLSLYRQLGEDDGTVLPLDEACRLFRRLESYPDYHLHVAVVDHRIVGTFALLIMDNLAHHGARSAILEDVVVEKARRGQGIGKKMITYAGDLCRQKGCYKIVLSSNRRRTSAHRFYERLGFQLHGYSYAINHLPGAPK